MEYSLLVAVNSSPANLEKLEMKTDVYVRIDNHDKTLNLTLILIPNPTRLLLNRPLVTCDEMTFSRNTCSFVGVHRSHTEKATRVYQYCQ